MGLLYQQWAIHITYSLIATDKQKFGFSCGATFLLKENVLMTQNELFVAN